MNGWLLAAAAVCGLTAVVHVFAGGPSVAGPLLASEMDDEAKYTNYYCWHLVTIVIVVMTIGFAYGAVAETAEDLTLAMSGLAGAFTLWSVALVVWKRQSFLRMPQWLLFAPITVLGLVGSWS